MLPKFRDNVLLFAVLGSLALPSSVQAELSSQLTVEVDGLRNQKGQVCVSLFASSKGSQVMGLMRYKISVW
nr:hypothetical protein [Hydrococcus rivularis]